MTFEELKAAKLWDQAQDYIKSMEAELAVYKGKTRALAIYTDEDVNELFDRIEVMGKNEQSAREGLNIERRKVVGLEARIVGLEADCAELRKIAVEQRERADIADKRCEVLEAKLKENARA